MHGSDTEMDVYGRDTYDKGCLVGGEQPSVQVYVI